MYRNNKANLWLRTICVSVALLGMLFFTHSQFSNAGAPTGIVVTISTTATTSIGVDETISFSVEVMTDETSSGDATLTYKIGSVTKTATLTTGVANGAASPFTYMGSYDIVDGDNGAVTFTNVNFATSGTPAADYTSSSTGLTTMITTLLVDTIEDIGDVASVAVEISASGDDTVVSIDETVTVDVNVVNGDEGVPYLVNGAVKGDLTVNTLRYDIGASGTPTAVSLHLGDNNTHFTVTLPKVADGDTAGVFTFESVTLGLQNGDGDAPGSEPKTYTTETTSAVVVSLTDAGLTIDPSKAVTDVTSVKVKISASGDDTTVTNGETVNVEVNVGSATEGVPVVPTDTDVATDHTLQYKIGESGASTDLALFRGDNDTHFTGMLTVGAMTPEGAFTFESVTLSLQNGAGNALSPKERTYTTETTSDVIVTLMDARLTIDPPEVTAVEVLANATAVDNKAEGGDKVTFTAWITNSTDGIPLNVTVNYKISGTKDVTGSVLLANQGLNETDSVTNLWSGTLTLADNVTAGSLTIVSIVVWAKNMDSSLTASMTFTAADAKATNVVKVEVPTPVDNTTSSASASASDTSSSESSSDSPVSIFAVFILIASVSMAVGVYTLRRRQ